MQPFCKILIKILIIYPIISAVNGESDAQRTPCVDFYQYACSNYSLENPDPNYNEIIGKLDFEMNKKLLRYLLKALQFQTHNQGLQTYYNKMINYFESCNTEKVENLSKYMEEISLLWKGKRPDEKFDYWPLLGQIQSYGLNNLIVKHTITRNKNDTLSVVLAPPDFEQDTSKDFLEDISRVENFLFHLGIEDIEHNIQQLNYTDYKWRQIVEICTDPKNTQKLGIQNLVLHYPRLNLQAYLENLLDEDLNKISVISFESAKYFSFLNQKLWRAEELKHLGSYFLVKFLYYLTEDSTYNFNSLECVKDLRNKFNLAVNYFYYQNFFKPRAIKFQIPLFTMLKKISIIMTKSFEQNYLNLSGKQVLELKRKLEAIKINIGNLPNNFDFQAIQTFYQDLPNLDRNNYYRNHMLLLKHRFRKSLTYSQNETYVIVTDNNSGSSSSPYYVPEQNMIVIPFGCLQLPLFHYSQTPLQQLSLFGFVLAHELTHAFDTISLNYDDQGFPLSTPSDILNQTNFSKSLKCMQQLGSTNFIHERIADVFGVQIVYRTYSEFYAEGQRDWRQEFFVNLAQFFCNKNQEQSYKHDSDPVRLRQIVKNFPQFSEIFGCPENSPMNAKRKCRIY